jgi:hypothetical protein
MLTEQKITWGNANYLWNDFKLGTEYQKYLFDVYGITVENGGRVIWNHLFNVVEVTIGGGGAPQQGVIGGKTKVRKKIKLIFIMGDIQNTQTKMPSELSPAVVTDIQNHIEEQFQTKITLSDVQIIKG